MCSQHLRKRTLQQSWLFLMVQPKKSQMQLPEILQEFTCNSFALI